MAVDYVVAAFVEYVLLLHEVHFGTVVVVGKGTAFYFAVENNGIDGPVEIVEHTAVRRKDIAFDGDTG